MSNKSRKFTGVAFLDIEKAFDRVRPEILLTLLAKFGLPLKILKFIKALTSGRHLIGFAAGINLQNRDTTIGLPQGSILSPILFNLYIAFSHSVLPDSVKILYYADDIAIYCTDGQLEFIKDQMNNALDGLFRVGNGNIRFSSTSRFLSVVLDSELNWKAHVNHLRNRIMPRVNILKAMAGIRWGAHHSNLLNVYKGFIRPLLDWGCQSFNPLNEQFYLRVSRLQYASLRIVSGMMITTPTNVLLDINGEFPLDSRWFCLTSRFLAKTMVRYSHPLRQLIIDLRDQQDIEKSIITSIDSFHLPGYLDFPYECRHYDLSINTDLGRQVAADPDPVSSFERLTSSFEFDDTFYTDGSRTESDGRVGYAAFSLELDLEYKNRINNNCTEAEALAIQYAVDTVLNKKIRKAVIFSDSLSVLSNLENPVSTGILHCGILKIKRSLFECFKQAFEVHIFWIPSHRGIPGNERADVLAKESLRLPDTFLLSKCHYTNLYSKFKALSKSRASQTILSESHYKGARYFNHVRDVLAPPWYSNKKILRRIFRDQLLPLSQD
ncbi:uncharacterized protein LOC115232833 [Formica exsecta]|uniref:uncharacterized protein LOC115232833 n=1 Tax=Formica exsecta TaxID=72781 RepID=UPI001142FDD5|nr:uncharacterized protein LOC115232833 [Formica exsecta]